MKKLAVFFLILVSLIVIAGCKNTRKNLTENNVKDTIALENDSENDDIIKTTIIKVEDEEKDLPTITAINIPSEEDAKEEKYNKTLFAVTFPENKNIESDKSYHLIRGTAPENTAKIVINDFVLTKYQQGETTWRYIIASSLGNLQKGSNSYTARAYDDNGNIIGADTFTIKYQGAEDGKLANTGSAVWLVLTFSICASFLAFQRPRLKRISIK